MNACLLSLAACVIAAPPETAVLLQYQGQIVPAREDAPGKELRYQAIIAPVSEAEASETGAGEGQGGKTGTRVLWTVGEKGQGGWPWIEQFGSLEIGDDGKLLDGRPASVLYEHADGLTPVPLVAPLLHAPKPLAEGASWRAGRLQFEVRNPQDEAAAKNLWTVEVGTALGHKRTMSVGKKDALVYDLDETVFMGPGKKYRLTLALVERKQLAGEALDRTLAAFEALSTLREKLEYTAQGGRVQWNDEQLALLKDELPAILDKAADTPLEDVALRAGGDAKLQKGIAAAIEKLRDQYVGQPAPALDLPAATLSGSDLNLREIEDRPVVLHLWHYRDNPLVEPYGQIGYLDFLYRKWKDEGVQVYGIAVDDRLDQPEGRSEAVRSVRKLQSFMNVGYPIVLGGSKALRQLGDPERFGAELPLVVVIDKDGKIAHYHVGLYEVDNQRGLAELDKIVEQLQ